MLQRQQTPRLEQERNNIPACPIKPSYRSPHQITHKPAFQPQKFYTPLGTSLPPSTPTSRIHQRVSQRCDIASRSISNSALDSFCKPSHSPIHHRHRYMTSNQSPHIHTFARRPPDSCSSAQVSRAAGSGITPRTPRSPAMWRSRRYGERVSGWDGWVPSCRVERMQPLRWRRHQRRPG